MDDESRDGQADEQETAGYLAKVMAELRTREARLAKLEQEIAHLSFQIEQCSVERLVRAGDVSMVLAAESYRQKLGAQLKRKQAERVEAEEDVVRAKERRELAEEELETAADGSEAVEE